MRILLVDDDDNILALLERILSGSGNADVVTAISGMAALDRIAESAEPFDCALVDIQMPRLDGIALTRMIRETPGYQHTPILMLTAMQEKRYLDAAFAAGATDYVTKPFDFIGLRRRISEARDTCIRKKNLEDTTAIAGEMRLMGGEPKDMRLEQSIPLRRNDASIDDREFENYLIGLSRIDRREMTVFAVKIQGIEKFYRKATTETFRTLIEDVSQAVRTALLNQNGFLSYRGGGVFLCINEGAPIGHHSDLETRVNARLRDMPQAAAVKGLRVLVGTQSVLGMRSEMDTIASLSDAVGAVEDREASKSFVNQIPLRLLGRRHLGTEQDRLEQRAFARLLNETLPKIEDDEWARKLEQRGRR